MPVITNKKIFLSIAAVVMLVSIGLISSLGLKMGIDFTGGSLTEVAYEDAPSQVSPNQLIDNTDPDSTAVRINAIL